jgi:2-methylisocitrate lyase-like PEP mutase family enzyme
MADEWRESECDQPLVIDYDLAYGWWVEGICLECDLPLVIDYDLAYGWWVEGICLSVTNR